jgi:DNA replication protein DnaC
MQMTAKKIQIREFSELRSCPKHGGYLSKGLQFSEGGKVAWSKCPKCGAEEIARQDREDTEKRKRDAAERWAKRLDKAAIPARFRDRDFVGFDAVTKEQRAALEFAMDYAAEFFDAGGIPARSAIFCGKCGTGKTHLAVAVARDIMRRGHSALFTSALRMTRAVKETWRRDSPKTETQVVNDFVFPDLLIIDEIGVQFGSDTETQIVFDIINERYEERKPSILISNLMPAGVKQFVGDRVFDRLKEDGGECIAFTWESHRGAK